MFKTILLTVTLLSFAFGFQLPKTAHAQGGGESMDSSGFVEIREFIPDIVLDVRYFGAHNFMGVPVRGYERETLLVSREAALALRAVQADLRELSLSLKIYDANRPQRAVNQFIEWARDLDDTATKQEFYPEVSKSVLFDEGYISARSGHSRGSTLDLTIVPLPTTAQPVWKMDTQVDCRAAAAVRYADSSLDMGTGYDCFDTMSWTADTSVSPQARANRMLLKSVMERHGFRNYEREWWHYTLENEPFPDTYFDFPIR